MREYRRKQKFYTIVVGRRLPYIYLCAVLLFFCLLSYMFIKADTNQNPNNKIFIFLTDTAMVLKGEKAPDSLKIPKIGADKLMSYTSPVFMPAKTMKIKENHSEKTDGADKEVKIIKDKAVSGVLDIKNETSYEVNPKELLDLKRDYNATGDMPKVLIVHTHACETYSGMGGMGLGSNGTYRTRDTGQNMVKIGSEAAKVFKKHGIAYIHDINLCDYPVYNNSYVNSLKLIEWYLEKYPSIEFIFDIHRDAITAADGTPKKLCTTIDGTELAQAMIVCGTDASGLDNPNWRENLSLALKIQAKAESLYPGLMRPVNLRKERFNMHKTTGSLLFEIGSHANTLDEAIASVQCLAEAISQTIAPK